MLVDRQTCGPGVATLLDTVAERLQPVPSGAKRKARPTTIPSPATATAAMTPRRFTRATLPVATGIEINPLMRASRRDASTKTDIAAWLNRDRSKTLVAMQSGRPSAHVSGNWRSSTSGRYYRRAVSRGSEDDPARHRVPARRVTAPRGIARSDRTRIAAGRSVGRDDAARARHVPRRLVLGTADRSEQWPCRIRRAGRLLPHRCRRAPRYRGAQCGLYWARTSDLSDVNAAL